MKKYFLTILIIIITSNASFLFSQTVGRYDDNRDGNDYKTVFINGKTWFSQNLNYASTSGSWCYEGSSKECDKNGRLYCFEGSKNACPAGWRLPTMADFESLVESAGGKKSPGTFNALNTNGSTGFNVQYAGYRTADGLFLKKGNEAGYWINVPVKKKKVTVAYFNKSKGTIEYIKIKPADRAYSVRCVK
ncbi:MAG TPA: FISUMP domain-containing protein [Bacteroidales bacterium]|nr:FISUMP domain-containing protein [Bacteroidales bacterium]